MKRNNLIMPAYIGAVFLSLCIRLFWHFPMWEAIVAAVTCSSACFSIADYASYFATDIKNKYELISNFSKDVLHLSMNIRSLCTAKLKTHIDEAENRYVKLLKIFQDFSNEMKEKYEKVGADADKREKRIHSLETVANLFTVLGFLVFFCLVFFPEICSIIAPKLDVISVGSFVIILLTQYLTGVRKEKYNKDAKKYEEIYECWENILKDLEEAADYVD